MAPGNAAMMQQHMMMSGMTPGMPPGALRREDAFLAFPQLYHQAAAAYSGANANANVGRVPGGRNKRMTKEKDAPVVTPLYKTRLCNFHLQGACQKGSSCSYAHGEEDLRISPDFERTSVCPIMLKHGHCDKLNCRYAHNANELRTEHSLLKTKMCSFHVNGLCVVGQACRFAHSQEELEEALEVQTEAALPLTDTSLPKQPNAELWEMHRKAFVMSRSKSEALETCKITKQIRSAEIGNDNLQVPLKISLDCTEDCTCRELMPPEIDDAADAHHADAAAGVSTKLPQQAYSHIKSEPLSVKNESRKKSKKKKRAKLEALEALAGDLKDIQSDPPREQQVPMFSHMGPYEPCVLMDRVEAEREVKVNVVMRGRVEVQTPAQVVRGKVIVDMGDDDIPVPMFARSERVSSHSEPDSEQEPMAQQVIGSSSAAAVPPPPAPIATRGRSAQRICDSSSSKRERRQPRGPRVVLDIEDVSAIEGEERPNSADPPMVELRRRAKGDGCTTIARLVVTPMGITLMTDCSKENRCIIPKDKSTACSVAGRFAECAMCPRSKGQTLQSGCSNHETQKRGCAACSCGLKVVAKNSFLTVLGSEGYTADEENPGARRRSWSE